MSKITKINIFKAHDEAERIIKVIRKALKKEKLDIIHRGVSIDADYELKGLSIYMMLSR